MKHVEDASARRPVGGQETAPHKKDGASHPQ